MRRTIIAVALSALLAAPAAAQTPATAPAAPKSRAALAAVERSAKARRDADAARAKALIAAKRTELADLKAAQAAAMKANDPAEVAAIDAMIRRVQVEIDAGGPRTGVVAARAGWQKVATLPRGTYAVTASGVWSYDGKGRPVGPDGDTERTFDNDGVRAAPGALIARVGGVTSVVGSRGTVTVTTDTADVWLRIHDSEVGDNVGTVTVSVSPEN